jgi:hypothetical protein
MFGKKEKIACSFEKMNRTRSSRIHKLRLLDPIFTSNPPVVASTAGLVGLADSFRWGEAWEAGDGRRRRRKNQ